MQALVLGAHYFHRLELKEEFVVLLGFGLFFSRWNREGKEGKKYYTEEGFDCSPHVPKCITCVVTVKL